MHPEKDIPNEEGFTVPNGYFKKLEKQINIQIDFERLTDSKKDSSFEVPEAYFEKSKKIVLESVEIQFEEKTSFKLIPMLRNISVAIAAGVILVLTFKPFTSNVNLWNIDPVAVESYLEQRSLENIEYDVEWLTDTQSTDLLLDGISANSNDILNYLQQETDLMDLNID